MKKNYIFITLLLYIFTCVNVYAGEVVNKMTLVPANESFNINTDNFDYRNIKYYATVTDSNYGAIDIDSIHNKTDKSRPISFNIMLFNKNKDYIGYVSYCSIKELDSKFAQTYLKPDAREAVTIPVDLKYLSAKYDKEDVAYLVFANDNSDCKIIDKNKYAGLSLYGIETGKPSPKYDKNSLENRVNRIINLGLPKFLLIFLVIAAIYTTVLMVINALYNKMYNKSSYLAWIPIINSVASMRVAFGSIIAVLYLVLLLVGLYSFIILNKMTILLISALLMTLSFMLNVVKLTTGQYTLMYLDFAPPNAGTPRRRKKDGDANISTEPATLIQESSGEVSTMDVSSVTMTPVQTAMTPVNQTSMTPAVLSMQPVGNAPAPQQVEVDTQPIVIDDVDDSDAKEDDFEFQ